jgi:hypothetical protein
MSRIRRVRPLNSIRLPRPLQIEWLEDRTVPSTSIVAFGADAGGPRVTVLDRATGAVLNDFFAYDPSFTGGVRVAVGDLNGDGTPDVVTAPGHGGGPLVKVFDGKSGAQLQNFFAFAPTFTGGVNLAVGDVNGDGTPDIVAGADAGGGPEVKVFDGKTGSVLRDFFAFEPSFLGGVQVAVGDVNGDSKGDLVVAAGPGGGPIVRVFGGAAGNILSSFFAYQPTFTGGASVAAADLNADGKAEIITGAGAGGGPQVNILDAMTGNVLSSFMAYDPSFTGGVRVGAFSLDNAGRPNILTAPGTGGSADVRVFDAPGGNASALYTGFTSAFRGGAFVAGAGLSPMLNQLTGGTLGNFFQDPSITGPVLVQLHLNPLDIKLLGLEVQTNPITVTVSVESGSGKLLGNLLSVVSSLINLQGVNNALNTVLGNVVTLLNSASLAVNVNTTSGPLSNTTTAATTPVLDAFVAPVHLDLLGAKVDTSPIHLTITAHSGDGLILGNVITDLANLFNPPLPDKLNLDFINARLQQLINELNAQIPNIGSAPMTTPTPITDTSEILRLTVPPIDLNLLGLVLQTSQIQVNADAITGNGDLLGNVLTTLLNTLGATPDNLTTLNDNLNAILAKVIGVLNASSLTLPAGAVGSLSQVLQTLALPDLVNTSGEPATAPVLNLSIASADGTSPPVNVNLLGLKITTSNIKAQLLAQTGEGQILGNLVYNVSHLLDPGGALSLLGILQQLGL